MMSKLQHDFFLEMATKAARSSNNLLSSRGDHSDLGSLSEKLISKGSRHP